LEKEAKKVEKGYLQVQLMAFKVQLYK